MINGIINVYKEAGFTSHDVVAKLRGILHQKKIGHTGTLDPEAVGVLPVCLGNGTKLCDMLTDKSKEYEALMRLGVRTDTQDLTGKVLEEREVAVTEEEAVTAILSFLGPYEQTPPMYSALKVNGKKLYELARAGKEVERKSRTVQIGSIDILQINMPDIRFRVSCSKGTYIRTLCDDIGRKLGCGAAMASLKRTRVGVFTIDEAMTLSEIEKAAHGGGKGIEAFVVPVDRMFEALPCVTVKPEAERLLENGNAFPVSMTVGECLRKEGQTRVYGTTGRFYGIFALEEENRKSVGLQSGIYKPVKMFL